MAEITIDNTVTEISVTTDKSGPQGPKGDTGNGIARIEKTATAGLVDTYTIYFTNGATSTFEVTNGDDGGVASVNGQTGAVVITASDLGALTAETDPVFSASAAAGIDSDDITAWDGKYEKPSGGIPVSHLNSTAQSRLMPTGGTTGQVLAKKSNTNYDTEWKTVSGGGAVDSVNGQTGVVVLDADDVGALPDTYTAPVTSVNSKTGAVTLTASDVGALSSSTSYVSSFNGLSGAVTYSAPVTSVNGNTGAVTTPNTTYSISISSNVITLTGSDSSTSTVTLPVYNGGVS